MLSDKDNMTATKFALSGELIGHEKDVRGVAALPQGYVVTASRDRSARCADRLVARPVLIHGRVTRLGDKILAIV
jgi:hypothetical protein